MFLIFSSNCARWRSQIEGIRVEPCVAVWLVSIGWENSKSFSRDHNMLQNTVSYTFHCAYSELSRQFDVDKIMWYEREGHVTVTWLSQDVFWFSRIESEVSKLRRGLSIFKFSKIFLRSSNHFRFWNAFCNTYPRQYKKGKISHVTFSNFESVKT